MGDGSRVKQIAIWWEQELIFFMNVCEMLVANTTCSITDDQQEVLEQEAMYAHMYLMFKCLLVEVMEFNKSLNYVLSREGK